MSQIDKLVTKIYSSPIPSDMTFRDIAKILSYYGYEQSEKGKTSGSRVRFFNSDTKHKVLLHRPHPDDKLGKCALRDVVE